MSHMRFRIEFSPEADMMGPIRRFISDTCERLSKDPELNHNVEVAAQELLENAVKYSTGDGDSSISIGFGPAGSILVSASNRASPENIAIVKDRLAGIANAADAFAHYVALMRASARSETESGLGLARIRGECGFDLSMDAPNNGSVRITVEAPLSEVAK